MYKRHHSFGAAPGAATMDVALKGASVLVGAGIAKFVVNGIGDLSLPKDPSTKKKVPRGQTFVDDKGKTQTSEPMIPDALSALAPVGVGILMAWYVDDKIPASNTKLKDINGGAAVGMVAYGLGRFINAVLPKATAEDRSKAIEKLKPDASAEEKAKAGDKVGDIVGKFLPLAGLGELYQPSIGPDVYDIPNFSRGYGIRAYGVGGSPFSSEAVNGFNGAVVSSSLVPMGMNGLGANSPMTASVVPAPGYQPPLSASLM